MSTEAVKFLERMSVVQNFDDGDSLETVTITEAIYATELAIKEKLEYIASYLAEHGEARTIAYLRDELTIKKHKK